jgi:hypothetical protein
VEDEEARRDSSSDRKSRVLNPGEAFFWRDKGYRMDPHPLSRSFSNDGPLLIFRKRAFHPLVDFFLIFYDGQKEESYG